MSEAVEEYLAEIRRLEEINGELLKALKNARPLVEVQSYAPSLIMHGIDRAIAKAEGGKGEVC